MRILVMGAKGMLGTDMIRDWKSDDVIAADSAEADIRDLQQVRTLVANANPEWIVLAAAYTDVDGSEKNRESRNQIRPHVYPPGRSQHTTTCIHLAVTRLR